MSSKYPILDNRPIDNWKVTELKEELKKRKLATKGLKDDLIKRLDEALRTERENNEQDVITGLDLDNQPEPIVSEEGQVVSDDSPIQIEDVSADHVDINDSAEAIGQEPKENVSVSDNDSSKVGGEPAATFEASIEVSKNVASEVILVGQDAKSFGIEEENGDSKSQPDNEGSMPQPDNEGSMPQPDNEGSMPQPDNEGSMPQPDNESSMPQPDNEGSMPQPDNEGSKPQLESEVTELQLGSEGSKPQFGNVGSKPPLQNEDSEPQPDNEGSKSQLDKEDPKPQEVNECLRASHEDVLHGSSTPNKQVSEVSPNLGFQVKSDSISTDSVSINEKTELKDNIITDNVKLELDVNPEMVEASSNNMPHVGGESHPMDVEEPLDDKASVEEKDDINAASADVSKKNDIVDVGESEKLNLDRSSGDDSMEEDVLESKQIDPKYHTDDVGDKSEKRTEIHVVKEENLVDVVGNHSSIDEKDMHVEQKSRPAVIAEKRKLNGGCCILNVSSYLE